MGTPYPGVREQVQRHLVGPVLAALQAWDPVVGLVVGSYQGCSEGLHALAREVAEERARTEWRQMDARSEHEALGIFVHDVHRRWGSVCSGGRGRASSVAACPPSGGRTPRSSTAARRPRTRVGKRPWAGRSRGRRCTPASCVGCAPRRACERRAVAAGWQVALAAAKFARLWNLDWTLMSVVCACRPLEVPPPAYARGQAFLVGGAEPWPRVHPGVLRGVRAAAGSK